MKTVASKRYSNKSNLLKQNLLSEAHGFTEDKNGSAGGETAGAESSILPHWCRVLGFRSLSASGEFMWRIDEDGCPQLTQTPQLLFL